MNIDPRSLAVFRMALGGLVLGVVLQLAPDFSVFFHLPSIHPRLIWLVLFLFLPLSSFLLAFGFLTRLSTIACWLGLVIVQQANSYIFYGSDTLLRLLLYWSIFLPLGATWSLDARIFSQPNPGLPLMNRLAPWAITLQICMLYWFTVAFKNDPLWTQNGNALFYALSIEVSTSNLGLHLRQFPHLLQFLTHATLCGESIGPFLLFVPFYRGHFRMVAVLLFFIFHLIGIQSLLRIGLFPWVCAVAWLIFIPGFFWDFFTPRPRLPAATPPARPKWSRLLDLSMAGLLIFSLGDVVAWNLDAFPKGNAQNWMKAHDFTNPVLHLKQRWMLFAPPPDDHGWLLFPADLADGTQVDLFTGRAVSWVKPADIAGSIGDNRLQIYFEDLFYEHDPEELKPYGDYLSGKWNHQHPNNRVRTLSIIYMKEITHPDLSISGPERVILYTENAK